MESLSRILFECPVDVLPERASRCAYRTTHRSPSCWTTSHDCSECRPTCGANSATAQRPLLLGVMFAQPADDSTTRQKTNTYIRFMVFPFLEVDFHRTPSSGCGS